MSSYLSIKLLTIPGPNQQPIYGGVIHYQDNRPVTMSCQPVYRRYDFFILKPQCSIRESYLSTRTPVHSFMEADITDYRLASNNGAASRQANRGNQGRWNQNCRNRGADSTGRQQTHGRVKNITYQDDHNKSYLVTGTLKTIITSLRFSTTRVLPTRSYYPYLLN